MKHTIKALPPRAELIIVILIAFGYFMLGSLDFLLFPTDNAAISEGGLQFLIVYELVVIAILWKFLSLRGWKRRHLGLTPTLRDTAIGIGLCLITYIALTLIGMLGSSIIPITQEHANTLVAPKLNPITVLVVSALNSVYEEVFVCGYLITALRKSKSMTFAINASVALRLAYHLYQGAFGIISIIPLGFIFAFWFAKTGRLWPLIVAHGLFDLLALMAYAQPT